MSDVRCQRGEGRGKRGEGLSTLGGGFGGFGGQNYKIRYIDAEFFAKNVGISRKITTFAHF
jgi:hypothetical protein